MKNTLKTFGIYFLLVVSSCNNGQKTDNSIPLIDIEANMEKMEVINLSQFTDNIRYIPLETYDNMTFTVIEDCAFSDSVFIAKDLSICLLYDYSGKFISKIGNRGRGPGEYQYSMNTVFGPNNKIYIQSLYHLFEYNMDGAFSNKYNNVFSPNDDFIASWLPIHDSLIFGKISSSTGMEQYKALIFDKNGNAKYFFKNYIHFSRKKPLASGDEQHANIYQFNNEIFFKELFNDTLFYLTEHSKLIPKYIFDLGKFSEPISERAKLPPEQDQSKIGYYIYLNNVFQSPDFLFLDCFFGDHFPAKRLTPKITIIPNYGEHTYWYNTKSVLGIYNQSTRELVFCKPTSTDNPLFTSGLFNDIDGGPKFFPKKMSNDSTMVTWIEAKQLKDHIASDDFKNNIPKYPDRKKKLEELVNNLTEFDNPVLMIVTFKK